MSTDDLIEDLVDLHAAEQASRGAVRTRIRRVAERRRHGLGPGVSKASAARALDVSVPTLDKWIARGRVKTVRNLATGREQVDREHLVPLITEARQLRRLGAKEGVLARAIEALEQQDAGYTRDFDELYGEGLHAAEADELEPVILPKDFGPDD